MAHESDKPLGGPTNCYNCGYPLPVFTYVCGCGIDNTPPGYGSTSKTGAAGKDSSLRDALKEELARQRDEIRKSLKPK